MSENNSLAKDLTDSVVGTAEQPSSDAPSTALIKASNAPGEVTANEVESGSTERLQVIDEEKEFTEDLDEYMERWGLADAGFDYNVVSVFGSQSTGKSTLLNRLFGTTFDVMDESQRRQTTKGIWMCRAKGLPLLVMDVEGTDGRERGEDQDFERKSALFSLASSSVLLVNMWEHQVGLYQGANMGLLKTVMEVNLGMFIAANARGPTSGGTHKTLLLFVIRDHIGATPLENLRNTLIADVERIWASLSKPEGLGDALLSDYFDLSFVALPHKLLQPKEFEDQTKALRRDFFEDRSSKNWAPREEYHRRIPADGLSIYLNRIWEQVQSNKDLDLPTQQELLAQFRCDEIASAASQVFEQDIKPLRRPVESGKVLPGLGSDIARARDVALSTFDRSASRYASSVYQRKRLDLASKLEASLSPLFLGQLKNLHKAAVDGFSRDLAERLKGEGYDFGEVVKEVREARVGEFEEGAKAILLKDTEWTYEEELAQLQEDISALADKSRADETRKMVTTIERNIKKQLAEPVELALNKPAPDMWDRVLRTFTEAFERAEASYTTKAKSFAATDAETAAAVANLRWRAWLALRAKVDEQSTDAVVLARLRSCFEDRFRYDAQGVPRVWKPEDDIESVFSKAREETLELIPLYASIKPSDPSIAVSLPSSSDADSLADDTEDFDFPSTLVVLTETKQLDLQNRFRKDADGLFVEAKRSTVSSVAQIPYWIYGAMAVLGWNEFIAVLSSPVYFAFLLVLLAAAYIIVQLNLVGPLYSVTMTVVREVQRIATEKLREAFSEPVREEAYRMEAVNRTAERERPRKDSGSGADLDADAKASFTR